MRDSVVQDPKLRKGIDPNLLQRDYPKTWAYVKNFETTMRERAAFKRYYTRKRNGKVEETAPFYSMFDVGDYTLSKYKVLWPNMGNRLDAAVVSELGHKPVVPEHVVTLVAVDSAQEAHYIAALVNSVPFQFAVLSYSQAGGKSFGTPSLLDNIRIPHFQGKNGLHQKLSELSEAAHRAAAKGASEELEKIEEQVDRVAGEMWGLSKDELKEIQTCHSEVLKHDIAQEDEEEKEEEPVAEEA